MCWGGAHLLRFQIRLRKDLGQLLCSLGDALDPSFDFCEAAHIHGVKIGPYRGIHGERKNLVSEKKAYIHGERCYVHKFATKER